MRQKVDPYHSNQPIPVASLYMSLLAAPALTLAWRLLVEPGPLQPSVLWSSLTFAAAVAVANLALAPTFGLRPIRKVCAGGQRKIEALLNAVPEGAMEIAKDGTIIFANDNVSRLFGYNREELIGRSVELLVPPAARAHHAEKRNLFFESARSRPMGTGMQIYGIRKDGAEVALDISLTRIETSRGVVTYSLLRDAGARKAFERQLLETNTRLVTSVAALEQNALELRKLTELGDLLHSSTTESELIEIVTNSVKRLFPLLSGGLYLFRGSRSTAEAVATWGSTRDSLRQAVSRDDCWALRRGRLHSNTEIADEPRCLHFTDNVERPSQCIPLLAHGELIGVLHLHTEKFSDASELSGACRTQCIQALANQVALSTANIRLREALRDQSMIDPLTGLYNRRAMEEWFDRDIGNALRAERPMAVLLMDVDHFKRFNDRFGHECGDIALRELSAMLRRTLRREDIVCRFGGEEFVLLLQDTDPAAAAAVAETLRRNAESMNVCLQGQSLEPLTVSIGIASLGAHGLCSEELLRQADRALYRAKANGRNQVAVSGDASATARHRLSVAPRRAFN